MNFASSSSEACPEHRSTEHRLACANSLAAPAAAHRDRNPHMPKDLPPCPYWDAAPVVCEHWHVVADRLHAAGDQPRAARYFAANAFCAKSAFALATGLSLPALGILGYQPGQPMAAGVGQSLAAVYALVPCLIKTLSAIWLFRAIPVLENRG